MLASWNDLHEARAAQEPGTSTRASTTLRLFCRLSRAASDSGHPQTGPTVWTAMCGAPCLELEALLGSPGLFKPQSLR